MLIPKIAGMSEADRKDFEIWIDERACILPYELPYLSPDQQDRLYEDYQDSMQYAIDSSG